MGHELGCHIDVDDIHREILVPEIRKERNLPADTGKELIEKEIGCRRSEDETVEDIRHGNECSDDQDDQHHGYPYEHPAQSLKVSPERHFDLGFVDFFILVIRIFLFVRPSSVFSFSSSLLFSFRVIFPNILCKQILHYVQDDNEPSFRMTTCHRSG